MAPKTIAEKYQKHELRDLIYINPSVYCGSSEPQTVEPHLYDDASKSMAKREITYVPALFKCFDELIVNAIDHSMRLKQELAAGEKTDIKAVKNIKVNIDKVTGVVVVYNDGDGIDVEKHPEHDMYVPELIFGNLLTSTNYDQSEEKIRGGCNGAGCKLTSIFSIELVLETLDHRRGKSYKQRWTNNMKTRENPIVRASSRASPYTRVTWTPDYQRFGMTGMTDDLFDLFRRRTMDAGACTDATVSVYFNDVKLEYKDFEHYVDLFIGNKTERPRAYEVCNESGRKWEVVATYSDGGQFDQVSFVNGINTMRGGKHVDYIVAQVTKKLTETMAKKKKDIKPQHIRDNLWLFVKSTIVNPSFDSQTKETLTTQVGKFGSKCELSDKFMLKLFQTGLVDRVTAITEFHDKKKLTKTDGKKTSRIIVPKLDDANKAGTKDSALCTLILTEGDSARSMAIAGLSEVGRDRYGVFPLKGKILNVKDAQSKKIADNDEISNLKKILGLEQGKTYTDVSSLRYGSIMIMTDQDSVTGDTPLLLRDSEGFVHIKTIDDVSQGEWTPNANGKDYNITDFTVWTESGWTKIKHVMRHKAEKRIYRVLTHTGVVDVTEDHSLLSPDGEKVSPKDLKIGHELLHSFPRFSSHAVQIPAVLETINKVDLHVIASKAKVQYYQKKTKAELVEILEDIRDKPCLEPCPPIYVIHPDEAYAMGLFWADGSCGIYKFDYTYRNQARPRAYTFARTSISWSISNTNLAFLEKAKSCMEKRYAFEFKIINISSANDKDTNLDAYKLIVNGGQKTQDLTDWYRELFYDENDKKRIPMEILNASEDVRTKFFEGYYDGDGTKASRTGSLGFDVDGKIGAMGMYYLSKSLGYDVSINIRTDKPKVYCINLTRPDGHQQANPNMIKKIIDMGTTDDYVYDLETENHHFQAGVGQMIVHNTDGFHIRGLLFNVFQSLWPSLFKMDGFLTSMRTPIVKAIHPVNGALSFYNLPDFEAWREARAAEPTGLRGWHMKYYKGLGTSTAAEAKEYFKSLNITFYKHDGKASEDSMDLAFNKKRADDRKAWLMKFDPSRTLDYSKKDVSFSTFVHDELIHFSNRDLERSIPSMVDGFKESTRKIMFGCLKKKLYTKEIRVAQLSGYISEVAVYHHGEKSLQDAIVRMAQDYVGANNINLLMPNGQFGTRIQGGDDAASPRYIHTLLSPLARLIFREEDNAVLTYMNDDGTPIEPEYYVPVIPMVLVNGGIGIGTGFSTNIPAHNPTDVIAMCALMIAALDAGGVDIAHRADLATAFERMEAIKMHESMPWTLGFAGSIVKQGPKDGYVSKGVHTWLNETTLEITELPIGTWTEDYKEMLTDMVANNHALLKDFENHYTDKKVRFLLKFYPGKKDAANAVLDTEFKLASTKNMSLNNMHMYNAKGAIQCFKKTADVVKAWGRVRLTTYFNRKENLLKVMEADYKVASAKVRFIQDFIDKKIDVMNKKEREVDEQLVRLKYPKMTEMMAGANAAEVGGESDGEENDEVANTNTGAGGKKAVQVANFRYLTNMPIRQLTFEEKAKLEKEARVLKERIENLRDMPIHHIWRRELEELRAGWEAHKAAVESALNGSAAAVAGTSSTKKRAPAKPKK